MTIAPEASGKLLITGAAGFIGGNFSRLVAGTQPQLELLLLDKLSDYSTMAVIQPLLDSGRARFIRLDLADAASVDDLIRAENIEFIANFAAESHNDRAIRDSRPFVH